jgi:hypothetical protein
MKGLARANGKRSGEPEIEVSHAGVVIAPGQYPAYCRSARTYRDGGFKRWKCLLLFDIFNEQLEVIAELPKWFNLGKGHKPKASRRGNFLAGWVKANGGPPERMDRLSNNVFTGRMCRVEVGSTIDPLLRSGLSGANEFIPQSVVREILNWETGSDIKSSTLAGAGGSSTQLNPTGGRCSEGDGVRKGIEAENAN